MVFWQVYRERSDWDAVSENLWGGYSENPISEKDMD